MGQLSSPQDPAVSMALRGTSNGSADCPRSCRNLSPGKEIMVASCALCCSDRRRSLAPGTSHEPDLRNHQLQYLFGYH